MKQKKNGRRIVMAENVLITDRNGNKIKCSLEVDTFIIADVYVKYEKDPNGSRGYHLCEDNTFVKNVIKELNKLGYRGRSFGRAELGMQGNTYAVLEPTNEFETFVQAKYDFALAE